MSAEQRVFLVAAGREVEMLVKRSADKTTVHFEGHEVEVDERWAAGAGMQGVAVASLRIGGRQYEVAVASAARAAGTPPGSDGNGGAPYLVTERGMLHEVEVFDPLAFFSRRAEAASGRRGKAQVSAQMPGRVVAVLLKEGDPVRVGQGVLVVEAMKMENEIGSELAGEVAKIFVEQGSTVERGDPLFEVLAT